MANPSRFHKYIANGLHQNGAPQTLDAAKSWIAMDAAPFELADAYSRLEELPDALSFVVYLACICFEIPPNDQRLQSVMGEQLLSGKSRRARRMSDEQAISRLKDIFTKLGIPSHLADEIYVFFEMITDIKSSIYEHFPEAQLLEDQENDGDLAISRGLVLAYVDGIRSAPDSFPTITTRKDHILERMRVGHQKRCDRISDAKANLYVEEWASIYEQDKQHVENAFVAMPEEVAHLLLASRTPILSMPHDNLENLGTFGANDATSERHKNLGRAVIWPGTDMEIQLTSPHCSSDVFDAPHQTLLHEAFHLCLYFLSVNAEDIYHQMTSLVSVILSTARDIIQSSGLEYNDDYTSLIPADKSFQIGGDILQNFDPIQMDEQGYDADEFAEEVLCNCFVGMFCPEIRSRYPQAFADAISPLEQAIRNQALPILQQMAEMIENNQVSYPPEGRVL